MRNILIILFALFFASSCNAQGGGLGYWNPPGSTPPPPTDTVQNYMPVGYLLAIRQGNSDILYVADTDNNRVIRYWGQSNISAGRGRVIVGPDRVTAPHHLRYDDGNLFIGELGPVSGNRARGTTIKRLNLSSDVLTTEYTSSGADYNFYAFAPWYSVVEDDYGYYFILGNTEYVSPHAWTYLKLSYYDAVTPLTYVDGFGLTGADRSRFVGSISVENYQGDRRIVVIRNIFDAQGLFNSEVSVYISPGNNETIISNPIIPGSDYYFLGQTPSVYRPGADLMAITTPVTAFAAASRPWAKRFSNGTVVNSPYNQVVLYASPVIGYSSPSTYFIMTNPVTGSTNLMRENENGTYTTIRPI